MAKFSISLPDPMTADLDRIEAKHRCGRSRIIQDALTAYFKSSASEPFLGKNGSTAENSDLHQLVREQGQQLSKLKARVDELNESLRQIMQAASAASHASPRTEREREREPEAEPERERRPVGRPRSSAPAAAKEPAAAPRWKVPKN